MQVVVSVCLFELVVLPLKVSNLPIKLGTLILQSGDQLFLGGGFNCESLDVTLEGLLVLELELRDLRCRGSGVYFEFALLLGQLGIDHVELDVSLPESVGSMLQIILQS